MTDLANPRRLRRWLKLEHLEDRAVPAALTVETAFAPDRVLVTMAAGTPAATAVSTLSASPLAAGVSRLGFDVYQVNLRAGVTVGQAVSAYSGATGVAFAEADFVISTTMTPSDPGFTGGGMWGLDNANDADIDAPEAWDLARGTGRTVVAVIDTGVDYNHPDLAANMWRNAGETPGDGIDNDRNGFVDDIFGADFVNNDGNPMDDHSHGTHCAGTIGAVGNNGIGVTGVAWTTKIMALKFLNAGGSGSTSDALRAFDYAIAMGAKVLSNSWGGSGISTTVQTAIDRARAAGVIVVAAAGNNGSNIDASPYYPGSYLSDNMVTVAATTSTDDRAGFSNYGASTVTLGAPGQGILSTLPGNNYGSYSGTSMATPHVAGALAVLWDANPTWTYQQVIQRLKQTVDPIGALSGITQTGGRLNLHRMLVGVAPPAPPAPPPTALQGGGFEAPSVGSGTNSYRYAPTGSGWAYTTGGGVSGNNSAFTSRNPAAPEGTQVGFVQANGSISQTLDLTAGTYSLAFLAAQRANYQGGGPQTIQVLVDGTVIGSYTPAGSAYTEFSTPAFTLTAGLHTITFRGAFTNDRTAFLDNVRMPSATSPPVSPPPPTSPPVSPPPVAPPPVSPPPVSPPPVVPPPPVSPPPPTSPPPPVAPVLAGAGFEAPTVGAGQFRYTPTGSPWTYTAGGGVTGNGSGFTAGNPAAPEGVQVGFLQSTGSTSQSVTFAAGTYTLSVFAARRGNWNPGGSQTVEVLVDGAVVGSFTPTSTSYTDFTTPRFTVTAGAHTITLRGTRAADSTTFIDNVRLNTVSGSEIESFSAGAASSGAAVSNGASLALDLFTATKSVPTPGEPSPPAGKGEQRFTPRSDRADGPKGDDRRPTAPTPAAAAAYQSEQLASALDLLKAFDADDCNLVG